MILDPNVAATCRLLTERYHRAFEEELPRLESLGWKVSRAPDVSTTFARSLMQAILALKDELLRHTAVAEATLHPFAGTADGDVLLEEHLGVHSTIRSLVSEARSVASTAPIGTRIAFALKDGLFTLERNLEMFFALERTLVSHGTVPTPPPEVQARLAAH
jgi:iron-sulfur cluster repair protein YtfE (RIC family)